MGPGRQSGMQGVARPANITGSSAGRLHLVDEDGIAGTGDRSELDG